MAKRRTSMTKSTTKRTKRGGNWFQDIGNKIRNEFENPKSVLRQQFYREAPLRNEILNTATKAFAGVPGFSTVMDIANKANDAAKMAGFGRKRKYVKYIKSKSHGKHKSKSKK
jgi:hypothetical protein